tara:strand:- start:7583 stop:7708 length:126 start_codon:yes stop_codon:yes gene_type:complete
MKTNPIENETFDAFRKNEQKIMESIIFLKLNGYEITREKKI